MNKEKNKQTNKQTKKQTNKQRNKQAHRQHTVGRTDSWIGNRHTNIIRQKRHILYFFHQL